MFTTAFYKKSADYVLSRINFTPDLGIILGTALGGIADEIEDPIVIPYADIPNFLVSTAPGHAGKLILGTIEGKKVICMSGRFHYYEGYTFEQLAAPVRLFKDTGVSRVILTNAAGGVNPDYRPGDIMILKDHLNLVGASPMRGTNLPEYGPRFFDVTDLYSAELRAAAIGTQPHTDLTLHEGVYMYFVGPHFETAAEIRAARILGADAVGMSTVPEVLTARHAGLPVLAVSLITNMATGVIDQESAHAMVDRTAKAVETRFRAWFRVLLRALP